MEYEVRGSTFPVVVCSLEAGERMVTERGSMVWMTPNLRMETLAGSAGSAIGRLLSGESAFLNAYTAERGAASIAFGSSFPGSILPVEVSPGRELVLQKRAFLAAESSVRLEAHLTRSVGAGLFGGEGFVLQRLSGSGTAFVEIDGDLVEHALAPGQQLVIDTGSVAALEATVTLDVRTVPGIKNVVFGGEGIFNTVLTGPGRVWLQTLPITGLASALRPLLQADRRVAAGLRAI